MDDDRVHLLGVALAVAVALALVGGWAADAYLLGQDGGVKPNVVADATVASAPSNATGTPGQVTVTWADRPTPTGGSAPAAADHLVVAWTATVGGAGGGTAELGHAERHVAVTAGTWRLAAVGQSVTLSERDATAATRVRLVVTAVRDDRRTVVLARTVTL